MNFFTGKKITNLIIIVLVILNLILLGSFWYKNINKNKGIHNLDFKNDNQNDRFKPKFRPNFRNFLKNEFKFNEKQLNKFEKLREEHFVNAEKIRREINIIRKNMMELLLKKDIDEKIVKTLSIKIGTKISEHERLVFSHFQDLIKIADKKYLEQYKLFILGMIDKKKPKRHHPRNDIKHHPDSERFHMDREGHRPRPKPFPDNHMIENRINHLSEELDLTEDQISKIRDIFKNFFNKRKRNNANPEAHPPIEHYKRRIELDKKIENILDEKQKNKFKIFKKERLKKNN